MSSPRVLPAPVCDGFTYSLRRLLTPGRYEPMALGQMEAIRKAGAYRPKWYVFPDDYQTTIPAYGTLEKQVRITPGSYLWGMLLVGVPGGNWGLHVRITEGSTGIPLSSDFLFVGSVGGLLTQPRLIAAPGWLNVEISNSDSSPVTRTQLLLMCVEPCTPAEEAVRTGDGLECYR